MTMTGEPRPEGPEVDSTEELKVTFYPPLSVERRGWVFDILRRERVSEILDIGCGEGELITCLCNPPPWLRPPPTFILPPPNPGDFVPTPSEIDYDGASLSMNSHVDDYLYIEKIHALDISASELEHAVKETAPRPPAPPGSWLPTPLRWSPLTVNAWEGSLDVYNPEFVNIECIVSTEVIEHLPDHILNEFSPVLLGLYHPRFLLITTPSFTFNERFTAPDAPEGTRKGFRDPTNRTDRIFRHHDHKFEWTVEEFTQWCQTVADEWEYDVEIGGVGKALEADPWGRDKQLGFASQVAAFKRREGEMLARYREERCSSLGLFERMKKRASHTLLATHHHSVHPSSGKPGTLMAIGDAVKGKMLNYQSSEMSLRQFWFENDISTLCGGWVELLVAGINQHPDLRLKKSEVNSRLFVELPGFVPEEEKFEGVEDIEQISSVNLDDESSDSQDGWPEEENVWSNVEPDAVASDSDTGSAQQRWSEARWAFEETDRMHEGWILQSGEDVTWDGVTSGWK